jgi:glucose-1-phosphate cytidylyltransferase
MKVVILAGGYGTRFGKLTDFIPKPMIPVGSMPIVWHIMRYYAAFGHNEFILATGYKAEMIKEGDRRLHRAGYDDRRSSQTHRKVPGIR